MHQPLKTNGQSQGDIWPLKTGHDFSRGDGNTGTFFGGNGCPPWRAHLFGRMDGALGW